MSTYIKMQRHLIPIALFASLKGADYLPTFGFGRRQVKGIIAFVKPKSNQQPNRICPGRFFAESTLWMSMAMILTTCTIRKAKDANGVEITPDIDFDIGIVK